MSAMAKMNGTQGHGKVATNIWQVMNYQVPRGYVYAFPFCLFFFAPMDLLAWALFFFFAFAFPFFPFGIWTDENPGLGNVFTK